MAWRIIQFVDEVGVMERVGDNNENIRMMNALQSHVPNTLLSFISFYLLKFLQPSHIMPHSWGPCLQRINL